MKRIQAENVIKVSVLQLLVCDVIFFYKMMAISLTTGVAVTTVEMTLNSIRDSSKVYIPL